MKNLGIYPLLCRGVEGTLTAVPAATVVNLSREKVSTGRGDLVMIDIISNTLRANQPGVTVQIQIGGTTIINGILMQYLFNALPRCYRLTPVRQPGGQQLNLTLDNTGGAGTNGMTFHMYHENPYAIGECLEEFNEVINSDALAIAIQDFVFSQIAGAKFGTSGQLTVPKDRGNVIGIEIITDSTSDTALLRTLFTVIVGGQTIFESINLAALGLQQSTRPVKIFPIFIPGGETFEMILDTSNSGATIRAGVRFYFDR